MLAPLNRSVADLDCQREPSHGGDAAQARQPTGERGELASLARVVIFVEAVTAARGHDGRLVRVVESGLRGHRVEAFPA